MNQMIVNEEMTRDDLTVAVLRAKKRSGMSWSEIAGKIGMSPVFVHSAATGMNAFPPEKAQAFAEVLGLPASAAEMLAESPLKVWTRRRRRTPASTASTRWWGSTGRR